MKQRLAGMVLGMILLGLPACGAQPLPKEAVSGKQALAHVHALVQFGERWPGSDGHRRAEAYIIRQLQKAYAEVEEVNFVVQTPRGAQAMKNIIGKIPGQSSDVIVLAGHYDTLRTPSFVGANDGGSSAALLLELARVLGYRKSNPLTIWLVFFDGEEAFVQWGPTDGTYGSRYQAGRWKRDAVLGRIKAVILVDMIGDKDLAVRRDTNSTPWLNQLLWQVAQEKGYGEYFLDQPFPVGDDHIPFLEAGVPAVDLIDFDYGPDNRYWHTTEDTPDKLSGRSFEIVGAVVLEMVNRLSQRWPGEQPAAAPRGTVPAAPKKKPD